MAQPSLAALYKRFMKGQDITGMEAQREADIRFLRMAMPGMQYSPLKLAQVLQKYSLNRVISHYGKKLVREVSQQPEYQKRREEMMDRLYPDNIENRFKLWKGESIWKKKICVLKKSTAAWTRAMLPCSRMKKSGSWKTNRKKTMPSARNRKELIICHYHQKSRKNGKPWQSVS